MGNSESTSQHQHTQVKPEKQKYHFKER